jgi:predicted RNase H-like HicB family nuclease
VWGGVKDGARASLRMTGLAGLRKSSNYLGQMSNDFTAVIERDGEWFIASCPEVPGANGQGRTEDECRENLRLAIELIQEDRREYPLQAGT